MKEESRNYRFRATALLITSVMLITLMAVAMPSVLAHPPSGMTVSYDYSQQNLSVTISHSVSNPGSHFIDTVTIYKNSAVVSTNTYTSQPAAASFTYYYSVTAVDGDVLAAKADCSISGSIQRSTTATAPDTTPPTIRITSPSNNSEVGEEMITISGTASDDEELSSVQVRVGTGAWSDVIGTSSWSKQVTLSEGNNTIEAKAVDSSDNEATFSIVVEYVPEAVDETLPSVSISSPNEGAVLTDPMVTVSGSASDNVDLEKIEIRINEGSWSEAAGTNSWSYEATLALGNNTVEARATDLAGNINNDSIMVKYDPDAGKDLTDPVITIQQPSGGVTVTTASVTVAGTASDDTGLDTIEVRVNNGLWNTATGTLSWSLAVSLNEGSNKIDVRAFDTSGNMGTDTVTITYEPEQVDTQPPAVTIQSPSDGTIFSEPGITVSGIASDNQCTCRVEWRLNEGNWVITDGKATWSFDTTLEPGLNFIDVRVFDDSGNVGSTSISVRYNVTEPDDTTLPTVMITAPSDGATVDTEMVTVIGTASDDKDLYLVEIRLNSGAWRLTTGMTSWSQELTLVEGSNLIEVRAVDTSENEKIISLTITYEMPYSPGGLDGVIGADEYRWNATFNDGKFELFWDIQGELLKLAMRARSGGWISIGIDPSVRMKDADMIFGWVDAQGRVFVFDAFSTGEEGPHPPDTELGGTDDIIDFGGSESGGWTTIEITRNVNSTDLYDRNFRSLETLDLIWAYSEADDFNSYHPSRGAVELVVIPAQEEKPVDEKDDDEDGGSILWLIIILVVAIVLIAGAAVAVFMIMKKRNEDEEDDDEEEEEDR